MDLKPPLTYDQQIEHLINFHKLKIDDTQKAKEILNIINYYRLSGYGIGLKEKGSDEFKRGVTLYQLFRLYCFDSRFKNVLMRTVEQIEISLRAKIAYIIANKYGADCLENKNNFFIPNDKIYKKITDDIDFERNRQKHSLPIRHHIEKYNNRFPIWVTIELLSFGTLSRLFSILKHEDKRDVAIQYNTDPTHLKSWILSLVEIRNICAHYTRLYNLPLRQTPKLYSETSKYIKNRNKVFPILLILKRMLNANAQWDSLLKDIKVTIRKYKDVVNLSFLGFPKNWLQILTQEHNIKNLKSRQN